MFTIGYIVAGAAYTALVWYVGRNWPTLNSVSDIETAYKAAVAGLEDLKAKLAAEIAAAETKVASLKALV